uniref:Putative secreted peptide n=1 Tax=Anopheles braziliensis TaxID=58242 RepID=A0A2M3ZQG4_9DIPT
MEPWTAMRGMCILLLHLLYRFAAAVKTSTKLTITNTNHESSPSSSSSSTITIDDIEILAAFHHLRLPQTDTIFLSVTHTHKYISTP